jgi:hypothetical protein
MWTHYRPFGRDLYGTWYSRTTGVYLNAVLTSLSYTAFREFSRRCSVSRRRTCGTIDGPGEDLIFFIHECGRAERNEKFA